LSGRGLCDELITRPEESYRLWCVVVCDLETSRLGAPYIYDIRSLRVNDLIKIEFSRIIFEKHSNIKLHENSSSWSRTVSCRRMDGQTETDRQTDRHGEVNSSLSQFCVCD